MKLLRQKKFENGMVYALQTDDKYPIEVTDTFLPFYTKNAIGRKQNVLKDYKVGDRNERWMVGVSVASGCPVHCKFCATGSLKRWRNLTAEEIVEQVKFILSNNVDFFPFNAKEFKINYTRMGDSFLNVENVRKAIDEIEKFFPGTHHYISTIGIKGSDFSWIKDNITLQISLHSLDEERRNKLIPYKNKMTIEELGQIRTKSHLKTTINLTLVDEKDFDIGKMKKYFDPKYYFVKISPINVNKVSVCNQLGAGIVKAINLV